MVVRLPVTFASRHGSTAGIAERIAGRLRDRGLLVDLRRVGEAENVDGAHSRACLVWPFSVGAFGDENGLSDR